MKFGSLGVDAIGDNDDDLLHVYLPSGPCASRAGWIIKVWTERNEQLTFVFFKHEVVRYQGGGFNLYFPSSYFWSDVNQVVFVVTIGHWPNGQSEARRITYKDNSEIGAKRT